MISKPNQQAFNNNQSQKIVFLPLDSRPQTYDFPIKLAKISGKKIVTLPRDIIADFKEKTDLLAIKKWLEENTSDCDALIVNAEQLVHGGLIQAREAKCEPDELKSALSILRKIKSEKPKIKIYLSTGLMRTSITVLDEKSFVLWEKINEYSKNINIAKTSLLETERFKAKEIANRLEKEIPGEILSVYLKSREINHELNKECINLVRDNIVDKLRICQEDCSEGGLQKSEQLILRQKIKKDNIKDKIFMSNGTDEAGAELIINAISPEGYELGIVWLGVGCRKDFVAKYEDHTFLDNLISHVNSMNVRIIEDSQVTKADNILFILLPKHEQGDYEIENFDGYEPYNSKELQEISKKIYDYTKQKKNCYLLDLDCANGGTIELLKELAKLMPITDLCGYSAWNTACNSTGTILAQILASKGNNSKINKQFTTERILDDGIYQSLIRQNLSNTLKSKDENIYDIKNTQQANQLLAQEFLNQSDLLHNIFGKKIPDFKTKLRWPRLFEIEIEVF